MNISNKLFKTIEVCCDDNNYGINTFEGGLEKPTIWFQIYCECGRTSKKYKIIEETISQWNTKIRENRLNKKEEKYFYCAECDYVYKKGEHGGHDCRKRLQEIIKRLQEIKLEKREVTFKQARKIMGSELTDYSLYSTYKSIITLCIKNNVNINYNGITIDYATIAEKLIDEIWDVKVKK